LYRLNVDELRKWYQNFYAPNNAVLVVVGDVTLPQVTSLATRYFGAIKKHISYTRYPQIEPKPLGEKFLKLQTKAQLPMIIVGYTVPSLNTLKGSLEPYALEVLAGILNAGENSRLPKNIIRKQQIASTMDVYYNLYSRYQTQFLIFGIPTPGQ